MRPRPLHIAIHSARLRRAGAITSRFCARGATPGARSCVVRVAVAIRPGRPITNVSCRIDASAFDAAVRLPPGPAAQRSRACLAIRAPGYELACCRKASHKSGNVAVIAASPLGEGMLLNLEGRLVPGQSEGARHFADGARELEWSRLDRALAASSRAHPLVAWVVSLSLTHDALTRQARPRGPQLDAATGRDPANLCRIRAVNDASELPAGSRVGTAGSAPGAWRSWKFSSRPTAPKRKYRAAGVADRRVYSSVASPRGFCQPSATPLHDASAPGASRRLLRRCGAVILTQIGLSGRRHANRIGESEDRRGLKTPALHVSVAMSPVAPCLS